jgi:protein ImuA
MAQARPIDQLLRSRSDLWRGRRRPAERVLASGQAILDAWLPGGGWPLGRLIELMPDQFGCGELEMLLPMFAEQTRQQRPVLFAAPPLVPCPQRLQQAGLALEQLVIARQAEQALWVAEQALKSGLCGAVVVWHPPGRVAPRAIRRLQLAVENGDAPVFVCYQPGQQPPPSLAALRLAIQPGPCLRLLRGHQQADSLHLGRSNVVPLVRTHAR